MALLNDQQKATVIQREPNTSADKLVEYIQKYNNLSLDDFPRMEEAKRSYIQKKLNSMPNPNEQSEWATVSALRGTVSQQYLDALEKYIQNWESTRPEGNHVDEANDEASRVRRELVAKQEEAEEDDWSKVDILDLNSLLDYLRKYPQTVHRKEIDDSVWSLLEKENVQDVQTYVNNFPQGTHIQEAREILKAIVEWNNTKSTNDIFVINSYLKQHPTSPFLQQGQLLAMGLKQNEISEMRTNPNTYEVARLQRLLKEGIVTERELIMAKVMTEDILETLNNKKPEIKLPDIKEAIENSSVECPPGHTDVYFFGVPSTGKTCVLMGLSRSKNLRMNLAGGGGDYAEALQIYTDKHVTVPRTPGTFVTTLMATISSKQNMTTKHKVNLVEMSGEEFAFDIAKNPNHIVDFEEMGTGVTKLLMNDNRKVFFLIIDPTANMVTINREIIDGYDENTGAPITHLESCVVNQQTLIQKMVNLFEDERNAEIMKKVNAIHIIITKSDTLGNAVEREEKAFSIFNDKYSDDILEPLIELGRKYNINVNTPNAKYHPKLYTFSLGTFYVGGLYEYEQTDSNRLVKAIKNATSGVREKNFWDKVKEKLN